MDLTMIDLALYNVAKYSLYCAMLIVIIPMLLIGIPIIWNFIAFCLNEFGVYVNKLLSKIPKKIINWAKSLPLILLILYTITLMLRLIILLIQYLTN